MAPGGESVPPPRLRRGRLALRPTRPEDCAFVLAVERDPDNARYVGQWTAARHRACMDGAGWVHAVIEEAGEPVGYVVLQDADDPDGNLLLRRIALARKGGGRGRAALILIMRYCFEVLGFHRLWLYVAEHNKRALRLYLVLGFVMEGTARECAVEGGQRYSMHVLSLLEGEYRLRLATARHRRVQL